MLHLPWVLLGIRTALPLEGGPSPAEAVMGCQPILPGEFLVTGEPPLEDFLERIRSDALLAPRAISHKNTLLPTTLPPELATADFVFVRRDSTAPPLTPPHIGPFRVLRRSLHDFQLQIGNRSEVVSTHRLKTCVLPPDVTAAVPLRRGRPPLVPPCATTPNQKPGEKTTLKIRAEQTAGSSLKKCPKGVNPIGKKSPVSDLKEPTTTYQTGNPPPPPAGRPAGVSDNACSDRAAKPAGKTKYTPGSGTGTGTCSVPQSILRKQNPEPPRTAAAHSGPAFGSMGERLGNVKRVRFSCGATTIPPQVLTFPHPMLNRTRIRNYLPVPAAHAASVANRNGWA